MSLLAFSLAVGLLIDDAIVVRENIFRHMRWASLRVRRPSKARLRSDGGRRGDPNDHRGIIAHRLFEWRRRQFMKQFGLSLCFIMAISLFDALTNAPMMSAYFGELMARADSRVYVLVRTPVRVFNASYAALNQVRWLFDRVLKRPC